jgi:hypothetical protein
MRPRIVMVGSGNPVRTYTPPLHDQDRLPDACQEIGRELAAAGCDLVVFSGSDDYLEKDVVRGYLADSTTGTDRRRVFVRSPQYPHLDFGLTDEQMTHVEIETDTAAEWEVSYYRSIFQADGLVTVGGGRSTRIAGVIAIAQGTPVVTLAVFGGAGAVIRDYLDKNCDLATTEDIVLMGRPWSTDTAARLVASLLRQRDRRLRTEAAARATAQRTQRARTRTALAAITTLALAAATILLTGADLPQFAMVGVLLAGPMFGAIGGALLRESTDERPDAVWSAARGLGAGMLSAMLYVASQLLTSPDLLSSDATPRLLWFVVPLGIAAGYTFDLVYARLRHAEVLAPQPFER